MGREVEEFEDFVLGVEARLRRALVARYGREVGREATAAALAWAWEHRGRLTSLANPVAYLYRVGQSSTRRRKVRFVVERPPSDEPVVEPALEALLAELSERQRMVLLLVDGAEWTHAEVAELLGVRRSTVQQHLERARARLRLGLRVEEVK